MNLSEVYSMIQELEMIAGLPKTADFFTGELESTQREVMALNMSTHRARLSERLRALRERQAAWLRRETPPHPCRQRSSGTYDPLTE